MRIVGYVLSAVLFSASAAHAKDAPTRIGWVDSVKLDAGATEIVRAMASARAGKKTQAEIDQAVAAARPALREHLKAACAKVKAERHLLLIVADPLAADAADDVTDVVIKRWNSDDQEGVAAERDRLAARVAQLEAAGLTKPAAPTVPPPPPIQPIVAKWKK